jgi:hypothetical protein
MIHRSDRTVTTTTDVLRHSLQRVESVAPLRFVYGPFRPVLCAVISNGW